MPETAVAVHADRSGEPNQLQLRFFAILDGFSRRPPERALWRVLIDTALAKTEVFRLRGRAISAEAVHHVALALYMQADPAGVIHDATEEQIAEQCRMGKRHVALARQVLNDLRVVRSVPRRGRRPGVHRMNLGGLDWPAVRRRAGKPQADLASGAEGIVQPDLVPDQDAPDDERCGAPRAPQSAPDDERCGAPRAPQSDRCGALRAPPLGLRTIGLPDPEQLAGCNGSRARAHETEPPKPASQQPASEKQIGLLCTLARRGGGIPDEDRYRRFTRREADEAIQIATTEAEQHEAGPTVHCPRCYGEQAASDVHHGRCPACRGMNDVEARNLRQARKWARA